MSAHASARAVTVRRMIEQPAQVIFDAWTDPEAMRAWFGGDRVNTLAAAVDARVGGEYRLTVEAEGEVAAIEGTFLEVDPPRRLVFTWRWDRPEFEAGDESVVTVEFNEQGAATEVVVRHEGVSSFSSLAFHGQGWSASLEGIAEVLLQRTGGER